jgi:hypothetical protein
MAMAATIQPLKANLISRRKWLAQTFVRDSIEWDLFRNGHTLCPLREMTLGEAQASS